MYPVSKEYKKAISESSRSFFWTGKITTKQGKEYLFDNKDIVNLMITLQIGRAHV